MWEPVICTGKGLAVMIANFLTALVMVLIVGGIPTSLLFGIGWVLRRATPQRIKAHLPDCEDTAKLSAAVLVGCVLLAVLISAAYNTGQEICAKGWREVYLLTMKENRR